MFPASFRPLCNRTNNTKTKYVKDPEKIISINNSINVRDSIYKRFFSGTDFEKMFIDDLTKSDIEDLRSLGNTQKGLTASVETA